MIKEIGNRLDPKATTLLERIPMEEIVSTMIHIGAEVVEDASLVEEEFVVIITEEETTMEAEEEGKTEMHLTLLAIDVISLVTLWPNARSSY